jgi:uncharacterized protein
MKNPCKKPLSRYNNGMETLEEFVQKTLAFDHSGHGYAHACRVKDLALSFQKKEGGDPRIIAAAALTHDTIDSKLFVDQERQITLLKEALASTGYSPKESEEILTIITHLSWHLHDQSEKSLEAKIVSDADRLEALGAIGLIRTIEYGASRGREFYSLENLKKIDGKTQFDHSTETTLSHFYDKLLTLEGTFFTLAAEKEAHKRSEFLKAFLAEFYRELDE